MGLGLELFRAYAYRNCRLCFNGCERPDSGCLGLPSSPAGVCHYNKLPSPRLVLRLTLNTKKSTTLDRLQGFTALGVWAEGSSKAPAV